jgi:thioredoxin-like negative regulator of GroEL
MMKPLPLKNNKKILEATRWEEVQAIMKTNQAIYAILDFWAPWCGPCVQLSPFFSALAMEHAENPSLLFFKVNVDDSDTEEFASRLAVSSLPTTIVVDIKGKEVKRVIGKRPDAIRDMIHGLSVAVDTKSQTTTTTATTPSVSLQEVLVNDTVMAPSAPRGSIFDNPYRI